MLSPQKGDVYWINVNECLRLSQERNAIHVNFAYITLGSHSKIKIRSFTEHLLQDTRNGLLSYRNRRHNSLAVVYEAYTQVFGNGHATSIDIFKC